LGIPVVVLIHFLQRKAQIIPVSTLFLLEKTQREASSGRHFDRLTQSVPLWMQMLAVALLTWLLVEPRYPLARSTQRIAIVLDSSASMTVSKERLIDQISRELPDLQGFATNVEYTLLESTPGKPRLYAGSSAEELLQAMQAWEPTSGTTDPTLALRLGRSLVAREGILIYASDTPVEKLPFDAVSLCAGKSIDNVGFTGLSFENKNGDLIWRATLQNYSEKNTTRIWQIDGEKGSTTTPKTIELPARSVVTLQSNFPRDAQRLQIKLSSDEFTTDDTLRVVRPQPKQLTLTHHPSLDNLSKKLLRSIDQLMPGTEANADIALVSYDPLDPSPVTGNAVLFVNDATQGGQYLAGGIIAEKHPLMDGLNWQSLLVRETIALEIRPSDQPLLHQDKRPLILLRDIPGDAERPARQQLMFNFDPRLSNIDHQPAMIVLMLRFIEQIRERKVAPSQENLETSQPIRLAIADKKPELPVQLLELDTKGEVLRSSVVDTNLPLTTPDVPGYFRYQQNNQLLMEIATHFADTREADFRSCGEANQLGDAKAVAIQAHSKGDPYWHLWLLFLIALLLISWHFTRERNRTTDSLLSPA
ncbi:MAG: hypothetical protein RI957_2263, partial [Verrucomicrobiota bacterium]